MKRILSRLLGGVVLSTALLTGPETQANTTMFLQQHQLNMRMLTTKPYQNYHASGVADTNSIGSATNSNMMRSSESKTEDIVFKCGMFAMALCGVAILRMKPFSLEK